MKTRYDENKRNLPPIKPNSSVRIHSKNEKTRWKEHGKVISKRNEPCSYDVLNQKGNVIRRNRYQLIPTNEKFDLDVEYDDLITEDINPVNTDSNTSQNVIEEQSQTAPVSTDNYHTRSGRLIKKPDRYGY